MVDKICLFLIDDSNIILKTFNIIKPNSFNDLLKSIENLFKIPIEDYEIFYYLDKLKETKINNDEKYKSSKNILFIRKIKQQSLTNSLFSINYNKLSESKQKILDEKYNCNICKDKIKNERPLFCYQCQKIFHKKCLEIWEGFRKSQNQELACPFCLTELPLKKWKEKLDFEENRKNEAEMMDKINKFEFNNDLNSINKKEDNNIKELKNEKIELNKCKNGIEKIIFKINEINSLINIENLKYNNKSSIDGILKNILDNIDNIKRFIETNNNILNNSNNLVKNTELKNDNNDITLIYFTEEEGVENIFGKNFVKNNKNNIDIIINGNKNNLVHKYKLKKGENKITLIIKEKLTNLSYMFNCCYSLKNIDGLKFLNTSDVTDFSYMFNMFKQKDNKYFGKKEKSKLIDINSLKYWNVSNCINFDSMFRDCKLLSDIKALENWNVSNSKNFSNMFCSCGLLSDIKPLENWNVSKGENF